MKIKALIFLFFTVLFADQSLSHSGGTNSKGCHRNHATNDYHCHNSRPSGAYENQMEGFAKSRSSGNIFPWLLGIGVVILIFKFFISILNEQDQRPRSTEIENTPIAKPTQLNSPKPATMPPPVATFKKEAALEAARSGRLKHIQLIGILDRARDLALTPDEREVFEAAISRSSPPSSKASLNSSDPPSFAVNRYIHRGSYESVCPSCSGAQYIYDADNESYSPCYRCGGSGYD